MDICWRCKMKDVKNWLSIGNWMLKAHTTEKLPRTSCSGPNNGRGIDIHSFALTMRKIKLNRIEMPANNCCRCNESHWRFCIHIYIHTPYQMLRMVGWFDSISIYSNEFDHVINFIFDAYYLIHFFFCFPTTGCA